MAEYINREQLLELINEDCKYKNPTNEYTRGCNEVCDWVIKTIKNIPTVDVVQIVRCKDCKYFSEFQYCGVLGFCEPNEYCSRGERRKEDEGK